MYKIIRKKQLIDLEKKIEELKLALKDQEIKHLKEIAELKAKTTTKACQHEAIEGWNSSIGPPPCKHCGVVFYF